MKIYEKGYTSTPVVEITEPITFECLDATITDYEGKKTKRIYGLIRDTWGTTEFINILLKEEWSKTTNGVEEIIKGQKTLTDSEDELQKLFVGKLISGDFITHKMKYVTDDKNKNKWSRQTLSWKYDGREDFSVTKI